VVRESHAASGRDGAGGERLGLTKRYGDEQVLHGIDLEIRSGELLAVVGPNGAGKTTLVEILEGYRRRDGGTVQVLGADPAQPTSRWRARIGIVLQTCELPPELTVWELVERFAGYYPRPRPVAETLELVGLATVATLVLGRCPAASSAGWMSRWPWWAIPTCCS
jgi:ABC-2 type transport system ATP-binding protein